MATMGGLFGMAAAALPIAQMLPPGVRIDGEHIHVDLRTMAAQAGAAYVVDLVQDLRITTDEGRVVVHAVARVTS